MLTIRQIFINKRIFLFYFLLNLASVFDTKAQQVAFNRVSPDLYFGPIGGITQDLQGYMWISSYGFGLFRYDGYHLTNFRHDPMDSGSLASDDCGIVFADHNGIIWLGTSGSGLNRFDPATGIFTRFRHKKDNLASLSNDDVTAIGEDREGTLWIGTRNGLNRMDQKTGNFTLFFYNSNDPSTLSCNWVQVLYKDRLGTLWVGCANEENDTESPLDGGLNRFDSKTQKFTRYLHHPKDPGSLADNRIGAIFEDSRGVFWVSTAGDGLHTMDREKGTFERHRYDPARPEKLSGPPLKKGAGMGIGNFFVQEDGSGAIWIGSSRGWVSRYDPKTNKTHHYDSFNGDAQAVQGVNDAFTSREGVLWITTWGGIIYRVDPFQVTIPHFQIGRIVHAIHEDVSGLLWVGTFEEGLIQIDRGKGTMKRFYTDSPDPYKLSENWVTAFYEEDDSTLWIGTGNGLYHYNRKTRIFTPHFHDPQNNTSLTPGCVTAIIKDKPGSLWIATQGGLNRFIIKTGKCIRYQNDPKDSNSLGGNTVSALIKDHSGNLWAGTWNGILNLFDPRTEKFRRFSCSNGSIGTIAEDAENIIWVGTFNGLYRSNPGVDSFLQFTRPEIGLATATIVTCILEDSKKNLWVGSSAGIFRLDSNRDMISVYKMNQGVDPSGLSHSLIRGTKGIHGEFFFADRNGYYAFFPDQFKNDTTPPQIVISDFRLADKLVKPGTGGPLSVPVAQTKEINLNYNQNVFSFDFAGIHYSSPEDNQHLYMLEKIDNNWRKASPEKRAYYYNVQPGKYIFRVKVSNSYGIWAEKAIILIVNPPWYNTWWAYILFTVLFLGGLASFIKWREKRLKKEKTLLERKVAIRTQELENEKQKVEAALSDLKATQTQLIESEKMASLSKLQQAMLNERLRISRELHDDIGSAGRPG